MSRRAVTIIILCLSAATVYSASPARAQKFDCLVPVVEVTVVDPQGNAVSGGSIELRLVQESDHVTPNARRVVTDRDGIGHFREVACGSYDLVSTISGFPTARQRVTIAQSPRPLAFTLRLGIACDDESGPALTLTDADRAVILGDLLDRTKDYPGLTVLLDENIAPLQRVQAIPARLTVLNEKALLRRSRGAAVTYISVGVREVKGSCVVAGYEIGCAEDGTFCSLCCEGQTYTYRCVDGHWKGTYFWGAIY